MKPPKLRVLICDDHELIREGLKRVLVDRKAAHHIGEAPDALAALQAARREKWDVVILDINLGGRNGLEVLRDLKTEFPSLPVLMLSSYPEAQFAVRALRIGASGYISKSLASRVLVEAIGRVVGGGRYISPAVAEQLANAVLQPADQPLHAALSNREDQVFRLIADGHTVGEIAAQLHLSAKTVSTYRAIVLRKLSLKNNAQLMRYAHDQGLKT